MSTINGQRSGMLYLAQKVNAGGGGVALIANEVEYV